MGDVIRQDDRLVRYSIARLAEEFGMGRDTVSKRLAQANVKPDGKRSGYPVYRLRDACPALLEPQAFDEEGNPDPRTLPPDKRKAWYQSELARLNVEQTTGQLIPAAEVEAQFAELVKGMVQFLDTLGDQLERDCALAPEQVERMNESITQQRQSFHERLMQDEHQVEDVRVGA